MDIKFNDKRPIYIQIMDYIKEQIISGRVKEGEKLPSVREMSSIFKVNPNTLQRVYQELEREGITYTQRGMGTFIKEDKDMIEGLKKYRAKEIITSFIEGMKTMGFSDEKILEIVKDNLKKGDK